MEWSEESLVTLQVKWIHTDVGALLYSWECSMAMTLTVNQSLHTAQEPWTSLFALIAKTRNWWIVKYVCRCEFIPKQGR